MQELLKPKEGWVVKRLGKIAGIKKGEQLNKSDMTEKGKYPALNGGIELSGYTDKWNTLENTITISEGGNSCGYVNFNTQKFWRGGHCYTLIIRDTNTYKLFLYQLLKFNEKKIMDLRVGSGLPNIQKNRLNGFNLVLPKIEEQTLIATILSDMDAEITALQTKLDKYRQIKQGMMQELLTGRIRLI